ncbi:MAG: LysM peptidoglycan-binding domain-containing protein [Desulfobacterales bacterium]|nr:LysM peptidoglycan-binding domain-containing protein [Desulfobacterales bacterium]
MPHLKFNTAGISRHWLLIIALLLFMLAGCTSFPIQTGNSNPSDGQNNSNNTSSKADDPGQTAFNPQDEIPTAEILAYANTDAADDLDPVPIDEDLSDKPEDQPPGAEDEDDTEAEILAQIEQALDYYQASQDFWQQGELENALHALDQAYEQIIRVDPGDFPKLVQQKDDLRYMISKRILEIYASRHTTAKGNHNAIPHAMNEHIKKQVEFFTQGRGRQFFINSYKRSGRYRPYILEALEEEGLPEELSWLPLVESGFKVRALSRARALGLWQFITSTGYKFGLERNQYIDERLDPYKSTHAAIAYLKELHSIFGDWTTCLAAYNCGENRVLRTIKNQNINYLDNFWDLYRLLPGETARYVPKFMATLHIIDNLEKYNMADIELDPPVRYETVSIKKQAYLKDIAEAIGTKKDVLLDLNPELRYKLLPEDKYALKIPPGRKDTLLAKLEHIPEFTQTAPGIVYHRVRPGETLSTIASRYHTTVKQIAFYNNIRSTNYIVAGKILKIPQSSKIGGGSAEAKLKIITYKVRRGDSLWTLAKRYHTTTRKIQELNDLKSVNLQIGQTLKIPSGYEYSMNVYRVKSGDSPIKIAKRHDMDLDYFLKVNNLTQKSMIYPGQKVFVK